MTKTSIRKKILISFLSVCVVSMIAIGVSNVIALGRVHDMTTDANRDLGNVAARSSSESLTALALFDLQTLTDEKAASINARLQYYTDNLTVMKGYVESIYETPSAFMPVKVTNYLDAPEDELTLHWFLEPDKDVAGTNDEAALSASGLLDETYLLGNAERVFKIMMEDCPEITTICIATESGQNLQFDRDAAKKIAVIGPDLVIHERAWYKAPEQGQELYISDTYRDIAGRGLTVTMSAPISVKGSFKGVLCFDIRIDDLDRQLREMVVGESGWVELLGTDKVISAPYLTLDNENDLPPFWDALQKGDRGNTTAVIDKADVFVAWAALPLTEWKLCYIVPKQDVTAPAETEHEQILSLTETTADAMSRDIRTFILIIATLLAAMIILTVLVAIFISRKLSDPIMRLTKDAKRIGAGDLDHLLSVSTGDEIEVLANTINDMVRDIKRATSEKERIDAELATATKIQAAMLPSVFPPFPERDEIDLYAYAHPAKEVGGDFYDFFMLDDNTLAVVIADVSGKGMPAALFMVVAKTLIKNNAQLGKSPKDVFETVNNVLCENNEESMFVTAFMAYLDMRTGELTCVNAGHNPPLLTRGGAFEWMKPKPGFILGGMKGLTYPQETVLMEPGDTLLLYTDGATEAVDASGAFLGDERLRDAAERFKDVPLQDLILSIKKEIDGFANGAEQADDITMLALRYKKGESSV